MINKFKKGDLVILTNFGTIVSDIPKCKIAMIVDGPYDLYYPYNDPEFTRLDYLGYDVAVCGKIVRRVPQQFLERMGEQIDDNDAKQMETVFDRIDERGSLSESNKDSPEDV